MNSFQLIFPILNLMSFGALRLCNDISLSGKIPIKYSLFIEFLFRFQLIGLILSQENDSNFMIKPIQGITQFFLAVPSLGSSNYQLQTWFVYFIWVYTLLFVFLFGLLQLVNLSIFIPGKQQILCRVISVALIIHQKCIQIPITIATSNLVFKKNSVSYPYLVVTLICWIIGVGLTFCKILLFQKLGYSKDGFSILTIRPDLIKNIWALSSSLIYGSASNNSASEILSYLNLFFNIFDLWMLIFEFPYIQPKIHFMNIFFSSISLAILQCQIGNILFRSIIFDGLPQFILSVFVLKFFLDLSIKRQSLLKQISQLPPKYFPHIIRIISLHLQANFILSADLKHQESLVFEIGWARMLNLNPPLTNSPPALKSYSFTVWSLLLDILIKKRQFSEYYSFVIIYINLKKLNKLAAAYLELEKLVRRRKDSLLVQNTGYYFEQKIKKQIRRQNEENDFGADKIHLNFFQDSEKLDHFRELIQMEIDQQIELWKCFGQMKSTAKEILYKASIAHQTSRKIQKQWQVMEYMKLRFPELFLIYGIYSLQVKENLRGTKLIDNYSYIINSNQQISTKNDEKNEYQETIVLISLKPDSLGDILKKSSNFDTLFEYKNENLQGTNIHEFIPYFLREKHLKLINNFTYGHAFKRSIQIQGIGRDSLGEYFDIKIISQKNPDLSYGLTAISVIRVKKKSEFMIFFNQNGYILEHSTSLSKFVDKAKLQKLSDFCRDFESINSQLQELANNNESKFLQIEFEVSSSSSQAKIEFLTNIQSELIYLMRIDKAQLITNQKEDLQKNQASETFDHAQDFREEKEFDIDIENIQKEDPLIGGDTFPNCFDEEDEHKYKRTRAATTKTKEQSSFKVSSLRQFSWVNSNQAEPSEPKFKSKQSQFTSEIKKESRSIQAVKILQESFEKSEGTTIIKRGKIILYCVAIMLQVFLIVYYVLAKNTFSAMDNAAVVITDGNVRCLYLIWTLRMGLLYYANLEGFTTTGNYSTTNILNQMTSYNDLWLYYGDDLYNKINRAAINSADIRPFFKNNVELKFFDPAVSLNQFTVVEMMSAWYRDIINTPLMDLNTTKQGQLQYALNLTFNDILIYADSVAAETAIGIQNMTTYLRSLILIPIGISSVIIVFLILVMSFIAKLLIAKLDKIFRFIEMIDPDVAQERIDRMRSIKTLLAQPIIGILDLYRGLLSNENNSIKGSQKSKSLRARKITGQVKYMRGLHLKIIFILLFGILICLSLVSMLIINYNRTQTAQQSYFEKQNNLFLLFNIFYNNPVASTALIYSMVFYNNTEMKAIMQNPIDAYQEALEELDISGQQIYQIFEINGEVQVESKDILENNVCDFTPDNYEFCIQFAKSTTFGLLDLIALQVQTLRNIEDTFIENPSPQNVQVVLSSLQNTDFKLLSVALEADNYLQNFLFNEVHQIALDSIQNEHRHHVVAVAFTAEYFWPLQ